MHDILVIKHLNIDFSPKCIKTAFYAKSGEHTIMERNEWLSQFSIDSLKSNYRLFRHV